MKNSQKGSSILSTLLLSTANIVMIIWVINDSLATQAKERIQYLNLKSIVQLNDDHVEVTIENTSDVIAKNIRLECSGKTAAGDTMIGDLILYDAIQPKEIKSMTTKELVETTYGYMFTASYNNIALSNIKNIECKIANAEIKLNN